LNETGGLPEDHGTHQRGHAYRSGNAYAKTPKQSFNQSADHYSQYRAGKEPDTS
jgi:hypothetical protein